MKTEREGPAPTPRLVRELLESESTITLATADEAGRPHAAPVFFYLRPASAGPEFVLWWLSAADSRHSLHLAKHPWASAAVYASVNRWEEIRGVQMEGPVSTVDDPAESAVILAGYRRRFRLGIEFAAAILRCRLYAFHPSWVRYLDNSLGFGHKEEFRF